MPPDVELAFRLFPDARKPKRTPGIREMAAASCKPAGRRGGGGESAIPKLRVRF